MPPSPLPRVPTTRAPRRVGYARAVAAVWLAVYVLLVAVVPLADARAEHAPVAAHWEDAQGGDCPASHDARVCQLCQVVTSAGLVSMDAPALGTAPVVRRALASAGADQARRAPARAGPASRAPPAE